MFDVAAFGDSAVLLPIAFVLLVWLWFRSSRSNAMAWTAALLFCAATTAVAKLYFYSCSGPFSYVRSPSGHVSMSFLVLGGLTSVIAAHTSGWRRGGAIAVGAIGIGAIAMPLLTSGFHNVIEIVIGMMIGGSGLLIFLSSGDVRRRRKGAPIWPLLACCAVVALLLHGQVAPVEPLLQSAVAALRSAPQVCV